MKPLSKTSLVEQVKERIKGEISAGHYRPGQRLEPVRELTRKLGVSHVTVAKAIKSLVDEKWIDAAPGTGSFVRHELPSSGARGLLAGAHSPKNVHFLFSHSPDQASYHTEVLCGLQQEVELYGWTLKVGMYAERLAREASEKDALAAGIACAYSCDEELSPMPGVPVVTYGIGPEKPGRCCVTPDNYQGGFCAGQMLWARGHRKVCFVSVPDSPIPQRRYPELWAVEIYRGLCDFYEKKGVAIPPPLPWSEPESCCAAVEEHLRQHKGKEHVSLVVVNRAMAIEIYRLARRMGFDVPKDLSILTFVSRGGSEMEFPLSTFDFSKEFMGRTIGSLIHQASKGFELPSRVMLKMSLSDDGSVAILPPA